MFASPAYAQTAAGAAAGGPEALLLNFLPFVVLLVFGYFLLIRPQQQRIKQHQNLISNIKRGDTVILSNGMIGKIVRVEDAELGVEIATGVTVKVVKSMVHEIRAKGEVIANDAKA